MKRDYQPTPFRRMVVFGESHTVGIAATKLEFGWPARLKELIDRFQEVPVDLVNRGIGADVVSKACPIYREYAGRRPIAIERYRKHVIEESPDLVVISFGYNDMRAGTPLKAFVPDMDRIVGDIRSETESVVVLLDLYFIPGLGYEDMTGGTIDGSAWNRGSKEAHDAYNAAIVDLAAKHDTVLAPVYDSMGAAEWLFCAPSGEGDIHANDLGHQVVANCVFEALATHCSALARKSLADRERIGKSPWRHEPGSATDPLSPETRLKADFYPEAHRSNAKDKQDAEKLR
jgi:lysophospholipase L1-like esterase